MSLNPFRGTWEQSLGRRSRVGPVLCLGLEEPSSFCCAATTVRPVEPSPSLFAGVQMASRVSFGGFQAFRALVLMVRW